MTFTHFKNSPEGYSKSHKMYLSNSDTGAGSMKTGTAVPIAGGKHRQLFTWNNTVITLDRNMIKQPEPSKREKIGMFFGIKKPRRDYAVKSLPSGTTDNGFRYLPFRENTVTYMQMDGAANFCITGPLTGCTIVAGKDATGNVWLFHANDNTAHGDIARTNQKAMLLNAAKTVSIPQVNLKWCIMTKQYKGMAFVFGKKHGSVWEFYVVDHDINSSSTNKFGQV